MLLNYSWYYLKSGASINMPWGSMVTFALRAAAFFTNRVQQQQKRETRSEWVSRFLTAHQQSAPLGYTVPFTLVHAGKYRREDKLKIQTMHKLNSQPIKANNTKHSRTKLPWFSHLLWHSTRKRHYNASEQAWGTWNTKNASSLSLLCLLLSDAEMNNLKPRIRRYLVVISGEWFWEISYSR